MQNSSDEPVYLDDAGGAVPDVIARGGMLYPAKPIPEEVPPKGNQTLKFLGSILLFGAFYYFFVSKDLEIITWLAVIVLIHELGHYCAMKIFNYEDLSIFFIPLLGAVAGGSKERISQKEKAIVLLAGPVPGIIIGIAIFLLSKNFGTYSTMRLSYAFVLINMLNLLPIYPLDGGQLVKTLFLGSKEIVTNIFVIISMAVLAGYAVYNDEWFLLIVPYFLATRLIRERKLARVQKSLDEQQVNYNKTYGELSDEEYWKIRAEVLAPENALRKNAGPAENVIAENENDVIVLVKSVLKNKPVADLSAIGIILFIILWIASIVVPLLTMTKIWSMI